MTSLRATLTVLATIALMWAASAIGTLLTGVPG